MEPHEIYVFSPQSEGTAIRTLSQVENCFSRLGEDYELRMNPIKINFGCDSIIHFLSLDVGNSKKSQDLFKGLEPQRENVICIFDEAGAISDFDRVETIIKTILPRQNCNSQFTFIANPPKNRRAPIFEFVDRYKLKGAFYLHTTIFDLPREWFSQLI